MKICILNSFYYPDILGGAEISVKKLTEGLKKEGIDVFVISTGIEDKIEVIDGIKVYRVKIANFYSPIQHKDVSKMRKVLYRLLDLYNPFNYSKVNDVLKKEKPDLVNTNNIYGFSPIIFKVLKDQNFKIVHTLRDYYFMCPTVNLLNKSNTICTKPSVLCNIYRKFNIKVTRNVDVITAPSKFTINLFKENNFFKESYHRTIYNAIDIDYEKVEKIYSKKEYKNRNRIQFVFLGTFDRHKGILELIDAFTSIENEDITLKIAGKGKLSKLVEEKTKLDKRITLCGFLNEKQKEELLQESDVLVIPSMWYEPFGRVVIEAYKYALPVIGSNLGGIPEIIDNNETGIIFDPQISGSLMNAMKYFIENKSQIDYMLKNCKVKLQEFNIEEQVQQFIDLYEEVIKS